ncbi:3-keto-disaccharide hydrolase [Rhodopirellula sp. JC639]|uniref:3-keto-disaccharide hydrolase n=1 Tax=Stieleria mannarensis TaxID=2755585 RepID=UPI0016031195|nr:family 16 glycoside hydrolase [Rhodopirellula sp. JC639]
MSLHLHTFGRRSAPVFFAAALLLISAPSFAQEPTIIPGKGPAYTVPPTDEPNYPLMGEFAGQIRVQGEKKKQTVALQIRPVAGDQFHAIAFYGALPGEPQHESEEMRLIGLRAKESLVLSGGPWAIFVDSKGCNLVSSSGKLLGRLKRVHRVSPTLGAKAPEGATVLFDGTGVDHFVGAEMTEDGLLKEGALISPMFQDFNLHVEFRLPYMPQAEGQQRGNSGLYLQSRYECQVLDSFGTEKMFNGLGALYRMKAPDVNMAFPPLVWQTYDVHFTAPRWASDGKKIRNARVTSWVNGVKVQDDIELPSKTGAGKAEEPTLSPINIQDHGDPVRFRNIWIVDRGITTAKFPVIATKKQRQEAAKLEWNEKPEAAKEQAESAKDSEPAKQSESKATSEKAATSEKKDDAESKPAAEKKASEAPAAKPASDPQEKPAKKNAEPQQN